MIDYSQFVLNEYQERFVQVASYPLLSSRRLATGQWQLMNYNVTLTQLHSIPSDKLPLFEEMYQGCKVE